MNAVFNHLPPPSQSSNSFCVPIISSQIHNFLFNYCYVDKNVYTNTSSWVYLMFLYVFKADHVVLNNLFQGLSLVCSREEGTDFPSLSCQFSLEIFT